MEGTLSKRLKCLIKIKSKTLRQNHGRNFIYRSTDSTIPSIKTNIPHAQCRNGSVQLWAALFVEANKQIEEVALRTVEDFNQTN